MGDRVECLLELHNAHMEWLLVLACLVHQYSEIRDLISCSPSLSESRLFICNFRFGLHSDPFQYDLKKDLACMGDKSNCSVFAHCLRSPFLGSGWMWRTSIPLATHQFPRSPPIFCAFCSVLFLLLLWSVLQGPHQDLWLCDILSDRWHKQTLNEVVEALVPNIHVQFISLPHHGTSLYLVQLQSIFRQLLTGYPHCRRGWNFRVIDLTICSGRAVLNILLSSLLLIPRTCLPATAVYPF